MERAVELLRVAAHFIRANELDEFEVDYDGVTCDGHTLAGDMEAAAGQREPSLQRRMDALSVAANLLDFIARNAKPNLSLPFLDDVVGVGEASAAAQTLREIAAEMEQGR